MTHWKKWYVHAVLWANIAPMLPFALAAMFGEWLTKRAGRVRHWEWAQRRVNFVADFAERHEVLL